MTTAYYQYIDEITKCNVHARYNGVSKTRLATDKKEMVSPDGWFTALGKPIFRLVDCNYRFLGVQCKKGHACTSFFDFSLRQWNTLQFTQMEDETSALDDIREEMSHVPLSELMTMQDRIGLKAFRKIKYGLSGKTATNSNFKRENKNRPSELSARRPVPRNSVCPKAKVTRDPRFDDLSGEFNEKIFKETYSFVTDVKKKEKMKLEKIIKKTGDKQKKSELKQLHNRMEQQELAAKRKEKQQELEKEWKQKEREQVMAGKKPFFLKKAQKRALLEAEYQKELNESGKMQKYLTRKNKKIAAKEKKKQEWSTKDLSIPSPL